MRDTIRLPLRLLAVVMLLTGLLTLIAFPTPAAAQSCGAANQRPCTIFERIPSCNSGLVEDFAKNRCVRPAAPSRPAPRIACGAANHRPCTVVERIPSCNSGLVEDFGRNLCVSQANLACGAAGQRPCTVVERVPSCNSGLVEDFARNLCVEPNTAFDRIRRDAEQKIRRLAPIIADLTVAMGPLGQAQNLKTLTELIEAQNVNQIRQIIESNPRIDNTYRLLRELGFNTLTVGIASSAGVIYGRALETGVSLDATGRRSPRLYQQTVESLGIQLQVGNDLVMSGFSSTNDAIGGRAYGATGGFDIGSGVDVTLWYDVRTLALIGFSVGMGIGSVGGGGAVLDANTTVY